jgi:ferric-dicitrate binding protein FerR (iron transport regulator)
MSRFNTLLEGYVEGLLSPEELKEFLALLPQHKNELEEHMLESLESGQYDGMTDAGSRAAMYQKVMQQTQEHKKRGVILISLFRMAAASVLLFFIIGSCFFFYHYKSTPSWHKNFALKKQIIPVGNKAILTLSDGSTVQLDSTANGMLSTQGDAVVMNQNNGELIYKSANKTSTESVYNTVSTPKGGTYKVTLPDGSYVMLNAASSIHFPTVFTGNNRTVEITGEAYFEISPNETKPFRVKVNNIEVQVLGTHFNINGYKDEDAVKVTLLEGAVRVAGEKSNLLLKPGQQARMMNGNSEIINQVDIEEIIAWKNGSFNFNQSTLPEVMRQISRWYDVTVAYEGKISDKHFTGIVSRNENISAVLDLMQLAGVKFKLEGERKIIIKQ